VHLSQWAKQGWLRAPDRPGRSRSWPTGKGEPGEAAVAAAGGVLPLRPYATTYGRSSRGVATVGPADQGERLTPGNMDVVTGGTQL